MDSNLRSAKKKIDNHPNRTVVGNNVDSTSPSMRIFSVPKLGAIMLGNIHNTFSTLWVPEAYRPLSEVFRKSGSKWIPRLFNSVRERYTATALAPFSDEESPTDMFMKFMGYTDATKVNVHEFLTMHVENVSAINIHLFIRYLRSTTNPGAHTWSTHFGEAIAWDSPPDVVDNVEAVSSAFCRVCHSVVEDYCVNSKHLRLTPAYAGVIQKRKGRPVAIGHIIRKDIKSYSIVWGESHDQCSSVVFRGGRHRLTKEAEKKFKAYNNSEYSCIVHKHAGSTTNEHKHYRVMSDDLVTCCRYVSKRRDYSYPAYKLDDKDLKKHYNVKKYQLRMSTLEIINGLCSVVKETLNCYAHKRMRRPDFTEVFQPLEEYRYHFNHVYQRDVRMGMACYALLFYAMNAMIPESLEKLVDIGINPAYCDIFNAICGDMSHPSIMMGTCTIFQMMNGGVNTRIGLPICNQYPGWNYPEGCFKVSDDGAKFYMDIKGFPQVPMAKQPPNVMLQEKSFMIKPEWKDIIMLLSRFYRTKGKILFLSLLSGKELSSMYDRKRISNKEFIEVRKVHLKRICCRKSMKKSRGTIPRHFIFSNEFNKLYAKWYKPVKKPRYTKELVLIKKGGKVVGMIDRSMKKNRKLDDNKVILYHNKIERQKKEGERSQRSWEKREKKRRLIKRELTVGDQKKKRKVRIKKVAPEPEPVPETDILSQVQSGQFNHQGYNDVRYFDTKEEEEDIPVLDILNDVLSEDKIDEKKKKKLEPQELADEDGPLEDWEIDDPFAEELKSLQSK